MSFAVSGTIVKIMNHVLGSFVENIDSNQFSLSMFKGNVELKDISIKPSVFDSIPIPFKLKYGKVGHINVDVPVMSLFSSPLKISIQDVFVLINPMNEQTEWNEKKEIECFISAVQSRLEHLEEYLDSKLEVESNDPGMINKMLSNIIDNVQIEISNICVRYEDDLSNPRIPFCIGLTIEHLSTYTANDDWQKEFVTKKDVSNKSLELTNFSLFLNNEKDIFYDEIMGDFKISDLNEYLLKEYNKSKKDSKAKAISMYKQFISRAFQANLENSYLLKDFCIDLRVKLNKNPKKNKLPQVSADLIFGGKFSDSDMKVDCTILVQQVRSLLKFLEYSSRYTRYQDEVLKDFRDKEFTKAQIEEYIDLYGAYKSLTKKKNSAAGKMKVRLKQAEEDYSYEVIAPVRQIAFNKYVVEMKKEEERKQIDQKVKDLSASKTGVMSSVRGFFGYSNQAKIEEDKKQISEVKEKLDKEFMEKYEIEEEKLHQELDDFFKKKSIFDPDLIDHMPLDWIRFDFGIKIPAIQILIGNKNKHDSETDHLIEFGIQRIFATAKLGNIFEEVSLGFEKASIQEFISEENTYLFETVSDSH